MKMIGLIPARGGSKGLPDKNIMEIDGKPLIAHTIEAALHSQYITDVYVTSDSEAILNTASRFGAVCPFVRPADLSGDNALAVDVYLHAMNWLENNEGVNCDRLCVLLPTSPLRTSTDIDNAIDLFVHKGADSVISCCEVEHPISWVCDVDSSGKLSRKAEGKLSNRQTELKRYIPNGAIFVLDKKLLLQKTYYSEKTFAYVMPRERSVDIDTKLDFLFSEFLMRSNREKR